MHVLQQGRGGEGTKPRPHPLHGRARLTKAIKRTLQSILEQAAAAHYLAAQLISEAVCNAQQSSKWNSLIWYFPIMLRYGVVITGGRWNICPVMEMHLIHLSLSCLIWEAVNESRAFCGSKEISVSSRCPAFVGVSVCASCVHLCAIMMLLCGPQQLDSISRAIKL